MSELVYKLIMDGARVLQSQKFLGGKRQSYETVLQLPGHGGKIEIHHRDCLNFIIEPDGWPTLFPSP